MLLRREGGKGGSKEIRKRKIRNRSERFGSEEKNVKKERVKINLNVCL